MIKFLYFKNKGFINFDFFPGDDRGPFEKKKKKLESEGNTVMEYEGNGEKEIKQIMETTDKQHDNIRILRFYEP